MSHANEPALFGLDGDRVAKFVGAVWAVRDLDGDGVRQVGGEDCVLLPVEVPAVVDGDQRVSAGVEAGNLEAAVQVALLPEGGANLVEFAGGDEQEERAGLRPAVLAGH